MPEVREQIEIEAPPEAVWDLAMDPERLGDWVSAHSSAETPEDGSFDEGDSFKQVLCLGGRPVKVHWTLTKSDRARARRVGRRRAEGHRARRSVTASRRQTAVPGSPTRTTSTCRGGPIRLIAGRIAGAPARRAARKSLNNLKRVAESEAEARRPRRASRARVEA